jgi:DNA-binding PadR family transcriptional regulator
MRPLTFVQFCTLIVLLRCPMHAYAIQQDVDILTERRFKPFKNTLKRALKALAAEGYIQDCSESRYWVSRRRLGTVYELTRRGRRLVDHELLMYLQLITTAKSFIQLSEALENAERRTRYGDSLLAQIPLPYDLEN